MSNKTIEDLKQVRDMVAESISNSWQDQARLVEMEEILSTLDRLIAEGDKMVVPDVLQKLEAKIRQKKGFYAISVGHDEVKKAHKAGILKGLDVVHEEVKQAMLSATPTAQPEKVDLEAIKRKAMDENGNAPEMRSIARQAIAHVEKGGCDE